MARNSRRFTIYDMMEDKGVFDQNPANPTARGSDGLSIYKGPVQYPKMLYHPTGEQRILAPAEAISTPFGPKLVGEQKAIIHRVVADAEEEASLAAEGWHQTPRDAMLARAKTTGEVVPHLPSVPQSQEAKELEELKKQLALMQTRNAELEAAAQPKSK